MKYLFILTSILVFQISCSNIPEIHVNLGPDQKKIKNKSINENSNSGNNIGFIVYDVEKKIVIYSKNRNRLFIPASVTKIPTTIAALNLLGCDYRFKTTVHYTGNIKNNILNGNLYIKGTGDPLLTIKDLITIIEQIKIKGIHAVNGNFYFDETELYNSTLTDTVMQDNAPYNTGISSLSFNYNVMFARWEIEKKPHKRKKKKTREIFYHLVPELPMHSIALYEPEKKDDKKFKFKDMGRHSRWLLPSDVKRNGMKRLPVKNPGLYTAQVFQKLCRLQGIALTDPVKGQLPSGNSLIYEHKSRPLLNLVDIILTYSNNLMAELLFLTAAKKISKKILHPKDAGIVLSRFYKSKIKKINWEGFKMLNGSGLTSLNRISPEQMLGLLLFAQNRKYEGRSFISMLPVSGWKGSLFNRLSEPETALYIWAKTGAINYAKSLTGYFFTKSGRKMMFVIFISNIEKRTLIDSKKDSPEKKRAEKRVYYWSKRSEEIIDGLLKNWISEL